MPDLIQTREDLQRNLRRFADYLTRDSEARDYAYELVRLGANFVIGLVDGQAVFAPSRFIGYRKISVMLHKSYRKKDLLHGGHTTPAIDKCLGYRIKTEHGIWHETEQLFFAFCTGFDIEPSQKQRDFWFLEEKIENLIKQGTLFFEGDLRVQMLTRPERSREARQHCLEKHGYDCVICGINFRETYGSRGDRFIHVHHLSPLSVYKGSRQVDPEKDLIPVCPNCHSMLHRGKLMSPDALRKQIEKQRTASLDRSRSRLRKA